MCNATKILNNPKIFDIWRCQYQSSEAGLYQSLGFIRAGPVLPLAKFNSLISEKAWQPFLISFLGSISTRPNPPTQDVR